MSSVANNLLEKLPTQLPETQARVRAIRDGFEGTPVLPRQFIEDPYYLGSMTGNLHPRWKQELDHVLDPRSRVTEWILRGAVGTGKTTCAAIAQVYKIYILSYLRDPAAYYGLLPGSRIVFGVFSITLTKADRGYELIKQYVSDSPYFQEHCPRRVRPDDPVRLLSKNIVVETGSLAAHALSENMFGYILDEANFFKKTHRPVSESEKTRAHQLYTQARRRQESRFMRYGSVPGLSCLLSSQRTQTEFLEERVEKGRGDEGVHVTTLALWDAKPASIYSGKKFQVMLGDGRRSSRVLDEDEVVPVGCEAIEVPVEHRKAFEEDTDEALRDLAGRAVTGAGFFFARRELLHGCVDRTRSHPFTCEQVTQLGTEDEDADLSSFLLPDQLFRTRLSRSVLIKDPNALRCGHVDIGLTGDSLGLGIGHESPEGLLYYDILLRVRAPDRGEIDLDAVVEFFRFLRRRGVHFKSITYDAYQSRHSLQRLRKAHMTAKLQHIGIAEYRELRRGIYAQAVSYYYYRPFLTELVELMMSPTDGDPDHPEGGSKDVADAAAGVAVAVGGFMVERGRRELGQRRVMMPVIGTQPRSRIWR